MTSRPTTLLEAENAGRTRPRSFRVAIATPTATRINPSTVMGPVFDPVFGRIVIGNTTVTTAVSVSVALRPRTSVPLAVPTLVKAPPLFGKVVAFVSVVLAPGASEAIVPIVPSLSSVTRTLNSVT
jgi:hypothetical protein